MMEGGLTQGLPGLLAPRTQDKSPRLSGLGLQSKSVGGRRSLSSPLWCPVSICQVGIMALILEDLLLKDVKDSRPSTDPDKIAVSATVNRRFLDAAKSSPIPETGVCWAVV